MKTKFQKLRHTSFDELRVRSSQAFAAFAERRGFSRRTRLLSDDSFLSLLTAERGKFRSPADLRDHFRERTAPKFFPAFAQPNRTTDEFRHRWPESEKEIVEQALRIKQGHFDLLGFRNLAFGDVPDWHFEPIAGKRSPLVHWSRLDYLDAERLGDKKIIWELNRHQYFSTLGRAYWLTDDESYANAFAAHIDDWMLRNPPKLGVNWASSLEVAFRSISWLWALYFFKNSAVLTPELFVRIAKFLYLNALHLETYLSTYFSPNTHLTGEALGLFYIGTVFPEFKESSRWRNKGLTILTQQLDRHVQADGVYFEQSSYYHRYTTDFYLHLKILLEGTGESIPAGLNEKLQQLLDHLMYITRPDGTSPMFGDDDGGRLTNLDNRAANDFRATLSTGAAVFDRTDYKFVASGPAEETLWLLGADGLAKLERINATEPERRSVAFEQSGYYVMRDGWTEKSNYLLFDCGHHGVDNCGHAHADALSFELAANGHTFLVDPGTYTYTASKEMRDWFRSSAAHNTITIDDESSSTPAGPFSWKTIANCNRSKWISQDRFDYLVASHDGYERLPHRASHSRAILFIKNNYWVICDRVESLGQHQIKTHFHCDSNVEPLRGTNHSIRLIGENGDGVILQLAAFAQSGDWVRERGWVSHCYGIKDEAPVFSYLIQADGWSEELITFLLPEKLGTGHEPLVREIEALHGRAFEINEDGSHDVLLFCSNLGEMHKRRVETARIASNFAVAWVRFENEVARHPEKLILVGGDTIELDGRVLLRSTKPIEYLVASRIGDKFSVETDEGVVDLSLPVDDLELLFSDLNE